MQDLVPEGINGELITRKMGRNLSGFQDKPEELQKSLEGKGNAKKIWCYFGY